MCALEGHRNIFNTWRMFRLFYSRRFYYKKEFCIEIIDATDATTFHITFDFRKYLKYLLLQSTCWRKSNED